MRERERERGGGGGEQPGHTGTREKRGAPQKTQELGSSVLFRQE